MYALYVTVKEVASVDSATAVVSFWHPPPLTVTVSMLADGDGAAGTASSAVAST